jgi:3-oxoacyl-[acyl-carrier protein] reductase
MRGLTPRVKCSQRPRHEEGYGGEMDLGIAGKIAIVTGGSRGLGREAAMSLAREGVKVAICARDLHTLERTVAELEAYGQTALGISADVTLEDAPQRVFGQTEEVLGPVDILVNNVGGRRGTTITETSDQQFQEGYQANLFSAIRFMKLAVPGMKERGWGRIVNISSIYGREYGGSVDYMGAKAALIATTKHMALDLAKDGVLVNCVAPGSILHPGSSWERFTNQQPPEVVQEFIARNLPMGRFGWPQPIGDTVAFLASECASLVTGACINVDGGQSRSLF